jgi:hypothetical protein
VSEGFKFNQLAIDVAFLGKNLAFWKGWLKNNPSGTFIWLSGYLAA